MKNVEKINRVISIDKSDDKHPNRILCIFKEVDPLNIPRFTVKAAWTSDEFHPTMVLKEDDIKELIEKLQELLN